MACVLAVGAFLKNSALLWTHGGRQASATHGDLSTPEACRALEASLEHLLASADGRVDAIAHDLHPDFHSTRLAWALAARLGVPAVGVQHYLAHIGVALAEHGESAPVIGIGLDGFGLGNDGQAWGAANCFGCMAGTLGESAICSRWPCPVATALRVSPGGWPLRCCIRWAGAMRLTHGLPAASAVRRPAACAACWRAI